MKGELGGLVAVVASWLSGHGGYSQTPWVRVSQLPVFLFSPFSLSRLSSNYSATCLGSTLVSTYSWVVSTPHSIPSSCTLCQPLLTVSTSDMKYRFGVPLKVFTKQVGL